MLLVKRYLGWVAMSPNGPSLPRRPRASVSVIGSLAAALGPWPARQLITHIDALRPHLPHCKTSLRR